MRFLYFLVAAIAFTACSGGGGDAVVSQTPIESNNTTSLSNIEPYENQQWYISYDKDFYTRNGIDDNAHINAGNLLETYSAKGVKIAVIDDGLDVLHEDLVGAVTSTFDSLSKTTNVAHTTADAQHGTSVTGIIGARVNDKGIRGIAANAEILFLKYKDNMTDSETIELFSKAEAFGAEIINCSWGTYDVSQAVKDKIVDLANNGRDGKGTIIVFASGNDDQSMGNDESAIPEVIAVGSTDKDNIRASYSNYGPNLDLVAPGGYTVGITTLDSSGINGTASIDEDYLLYNDSQAFTGTSASAPVVSAAIGLLLEKNSNLTRIEVETLLKISSDKIGTHPYNTSGSNDYYGYGKLNLLKFFQM